MDMIDQGTTLGSQELHNGAVSEEDLNRAVTSSSQISTAPTDSTADSELNGEAHTATTTSSSSEVSGDGDAEHSDAANPQENNISPSQYSADNEEDVEEKSMWTGSLETRTIMNSGKARTDSFLCGITPLNTPYTPASLIKFMKAARSQPASEAPDMPRRRRKRRTLSSNAPENFVSSMVSMLAFFLTSVRDISDMMMQAFLPSVITRHPIFQDIRPWILNLITLCTLGGIVVIGAPVTILVSILTAPIWSAAIVGYIVLKLLGVNSNQLR